MARFGKSVVAALTQPAFTQGLFTTAQQVGAAPRLRKQREMLSKINTGTPEGLGQLAQFYQGQGDMENAVKYATASRDLATQLSEQESLSQLQTLVATTADKLGLDDQAKAARSITDPKELGDILEDLRGIQKERLPMNEAVVKKRLQVAGYSPAQIENMDTTSITRAALESLEKFAEADLEAWQDKNGKIQAVRVTKNGKVVDPASNKLVEPSELGLMRKAPTAQEIIDKTTNKQKEKLTEAGVDHFVEMRDKADAARKTLDTIMRQEARVEGGIPTGIAANLEITFRQIGQLVGMPYDPKLVDAQNYMQETAELVKNEIKAFGSGTSITDADRAYTQDMVGGDLRVQAEALLKLLRIRREAAAETINTYMDIRKDYVDANMGSSLIGFPEYTIPMTAQEEDEAATNALPTGFVLNP